MKTSHLHVAMLLLLAGTLAVRPANLRAQAPSASTGSQTPGASQAPAPAPAATQKKVWTNDDLDQLRDQGGISVIGKSSAPNAATPQNGPAQPAKPAVAPKLPKEKDPEWYKEQLAPLYTALDRINSEIAAAQSAVDGETRGDAGVSMGARAPAGTPQEQLVALQKQQQDIQTKIDNLLDQARHNDLPPGDLR
ncbi:MAG: hypothetical protein ABSA32_07440 [Candidatus Acidiferrales bacterium]